LARTIVLDAERHGLLHEDSNILECTSGNTGIAFAMVGAARGYAVTIVMSGRVDAFVSGYGTGGTLAGCSKALRSANARTHVYAMEPAESALLSGEEACCDWIEGIAGGFVPPLLRDVRLDGVKKVSSQSAMQTTRRLIREFGLLVGS